MSTYPALKSLWLEDLTWPEVRDALASGVDIALVIVGATEQHGPHLPLSVDTLCGRAIGERVARRLGRALVAPVISVGYSPYHMHLPGTITLKRDTLIALIGDYCTSLAQHGFRKIGLISTHGGNNRAVAQAADALGEQLPETRVIAFVDGSAYGRVQRATAAQFGISPPVAGVHSGEAETSQMLAIRPDLVVMERAEAGYVGDLKAVSQQLARDPATVTPSGILGDPRPAKAEHGVAYLDSLADYIAEWMLARMSEQKGSEWWVMSSQPSSTGQCSAVLRTHTTDCLLSATYPR